jgi:glucosamine-6-phosphate deaminase
LPLPAWLEGRLEVAADPARLAEAVADRLLALLRSSPRRPLGLATGRTMEPVYAALVRRLLALPSHERRRILAGWCSFNLDEYVGLGPGDPRSFAAAMREHLVEPLGLDPARVHLPDGLAADPSLEARRYAAAVAAAGGIGLQLLGLGANGHVGFNEPPCGPTAVSRCVRLTAATRLQNAAAFGGDPDGVPERAITLGLAEIRRAQVILLVVSGGAKAPVLGRFLREPPRPDLPASWLQGHPGLWLLVDEGALGGGASG